MWERKILTVRGGGAKRVHMDDFLRKIIVLLFKSKISVKVLVYTFKWTLHRKSGVSCPCGNQALASDSYGYKLKLCNSVLTIS